MRPAGVPVNVIIGLNCIEVWNIEPSSMSSELEILHVACSSSPPLVPNTKTHLYFKLWPFPFVLSTRKSKQRKLCKTNKTSRNRPIYIWYCYFLITTTEIRGLIFALSLIPSLRRVCSGTKITSDRHKPCTFNFSAWSLCRRFSSLQRPKQNHYCHPQITRIFFSS